MTQSKPLKFIYFDIGGVAILDFSKTNKWDEMLSDLGLTGDTLKEFEALFDTHEKNMCKGEDVNIVLEEAKSKLGIEFPKDYDMTKDFVDRFEKNLPIPELIERLKKEYKLGLLTNQYPSMLNMIFEKQLLPKDIWDVIIDSSVEKTAKPDVEIYTLAENKSGVEPESILFIDNNESHLEIPRQRGWKTYLYDPSDVTLSTSELESFINS